MWHAATQLAVIVTPIAVIVSEANDPHLLLLMSGRRRIK
jgi:hypothetical protein